MKKYSFLVLLMILSSVVANAQCFSYSFYDFEIEDFIIDSDTASYDIHTLAYCSAGDTVSTIIHVNAAGREGRQQRGQVQVSVVKKQESMREIQSQRVAFFTNAMRLTPEEAQVFWPLYNQYAEKKNKLIEEQKRIMKGITKEGVDVMTKAGAASIANAYAKVLQQENDLIQEYHKKFMNQLPAEKVLQMYKAEKDFMQKLLWNLKGKRKE